MTSVVVTQNACLVSVICPSCQSVAVSRIDLAPKSVASFACLVSTRGAARDRHGRWERDAMDAHRRARFTCATSGVCADGEVVWSWRSDAGAKLVETIPLMTVATKHGHRGEHEGHR